MQTGAARRQWFEQVKELSGGGKPEVVESEAKQDMKPGRRGARSTIHIGPQGSSNRFEMTSNST